MSHIYNNSPEEVAMRYPRPTKEEYRSVFLALHADCKSLLRELLQATGDLIASLRSR